MSPDGYIALGSAGVAIIALAFAVYAAWRMSSRIADSANAQVAAGKAQSAAERNQLAAESQRDTEKARADKDEAELADVKAQLESTQAALNKADQESTENVATTVRDSDSPLDALNSVFASSARSDVPAAGDSSAGNGHQS